MKIFYEYLHEMHSYPKPLHSFFLKFFVMTPKVCFHLKLSSYFVHFLFEKQAYESNFLKLSFTFQVTSFAIHYFLVLYVMPHYFCQSYLLTRRDS